jgi:hypothetical protein
MFASGKSASSSNFVVQTFTANTTWVAPATVTKVLNASGYGGAASPDTASSAFAYVGTAAPGGGGTNPPYAQWGDLYSEALSALSAIQSNSGTNLISFPRRTYFVNPNEFWRVSITTFYNIWVVGDSGSIADFNGPTPTSGDMTYASVSGSPGWIVTANNTRSLGSNGPAATAFGNTFPGGTLGGTIPYRTVVAPVVTTYTNIAVTPGTSYPIVVPSGGSITLIYYG